MKVTAKMVNRALREYNPERQMFTQYEEYQMHAVLESALRDVQTVDDIDERICVWLRDGFLHTVLLRAGLQSMTTKNPLFLDVAKATLDAIIRDLRPIKPEPLPVCKHCGVIIRKAQIGSGGDYWLHVSPQGLSEYLGCNFVAEPASAP